MPVTAAAHSSVSVLNQDLSLHLHAGTQELCSQCGVVSWPHSYCRCLICGVRHTKVPGCRPVECTQCGLWLKPHRRCRCRICNQVHVHGSPCQQFPAVAHVVQVAPDPNYNVCAQCGRYELAHNRCRCALCGLIHNHGSRCRERRNARLRAAINGSVPQVHSIGGMDHACPHCHSRSWRDESVNCCASGAIVLPSFPDAPQELSQVILTSHVRSNIRKYNMALAMASVGHHNASLPDGVFTLGGKTFHRVGSMLPADAAPHAFAQIFVLDTQEASNRRIRAMGRGATQDSLRPGVLSQLHSWLMQHNPWVQQFVAAARSDVPRLVWRSSDDIATMQMGALVTHPGCKRDIVIERQVLAPCSRTACVLISIPRFVQEGSLHFIHDGHALYHPLAYPLLFPYGSPGWHDKLTTCGPDFRDARRVTLTEWGRYYLMHRDHVSHLQRCERLTMEFFCDVWAQVEARNAFFHKSPAQQAAYRAARVAALEDQLSAGVPASEIGQPVIRLPSSFVGSARYYQQLYLDAMALPKKFGKPDLFLTFTCNPDWPEIRAALPPQSHWRNHNDIIARVFALKVKALIDDIQKGQIFGQARAYVFRVEWQARGLPHVHMLIILLDKILSGRHIDAVISAELPDPETDPELSALVIKHMLHPQCDVNHHHGCRRNKDGALCDCERRFPKQMCRETIIVPDGYPLYRRRGMFRANLPGGRVVTDQWVVPHNAYLLKKYRCHVNVEACAHFRCGPLFLPL
jgi:hypothetical protein